MSDVDFAILTPVPEEHLESGQVIATAEGFVCFASDAFEFFRDVERRRAGAPVPVLFYQSHDSTGAPTFATLWSGHYLGHVEDATQKRGLEARHRPPTTKGYSGDDATGWGLFYKVEGLKPIEPSDRVPFYKITMYKSGRRKMNTAPQGPLLIDRPTAF